MLSLGESFKRDASSSSKVNVCLGAGKGEDHGSAGGGGGATGPLDEDGISPVEAVTPNKLASGGAHTEFPKREDELNLFAVEENIIAGSSSFPDRLIEDTNAVFVVEGEEAVLSFMDIEEKDASMSDNLRMEETSNP